MSKRHPRADLVQSQRKAVRGGFVGPVGPNRELEARRRADGFANVITGLGGRRDRTTRAAVQPMVPLTLPELEWLYHGQDLPATIVDRLPTDAMRQGYESGDPDLDTVAARWDALDKFLEGWIWGRLYGLGGVYMGFSDRLGPQDQPLDVSRILPGDLQFLLPVDGQDLSVADRVTNPKSAHYGEIRTFHLGTVHAAARAMVPIHVSRFILFPGARTSARVRLHLGDRDLSVLQRPFEILRDVDGSWRSVMLLLQDLSQAVFKIKGLEAIIAEGRKDEVLTRMEIVDMARSVARAVVVDAEGEDFRHEGAANITGIDPLLARIFTRLSAAAEMPLTVLMGTSPAGMNATGESDLRIWYGHVDSARRRVSNQIETLYRVLAANAGIVWKGGGKWPALWTPTETEAAALEKTNAETDSIDIASGVKTAEEAALIRFGGVTPEDAIDLAGRQARTAGAAPVDDSIKVTAGSAWTDTEDGHALEVTAVAGGSVYFCDLDSPNPARQYSWRTRTFLERARPVAPVA